MADPATDHFNFFLKSRPSLEELARYVFIGPKWNLLGTLLHIDYHQLESIRIGNDGDNNKTVKMFSLWLSSANTASREVVLKNLKEPCLYEGRVAYFYKDALRSRYKSIGKLKAQ